jgi:hypothetical protein
MATWKDKFTDAQWEMANKYMASHSVRGILHGVQIGAVAAKVPIRSYSKREAWAKDAAQVAAGFYERGIPTLEAILDELFGKPTAGTASGGGTSPGSAGSGLPEASAPESTATQPTAPAGARPAERPASGSATGKRGGGEFTTESGTSLTAAEVEAITGGAQFAGFEAASELPQAIRELNRRVCACQRCMGGAR